MKIFLLKPAECEQSKKEIFFDLVMKGEQVNEITLKQNIECAEFLAFCQFNNKIVGVSAIKNPNPNYRRRIFSYAGVEHLLEKYEAELGYAYTEKEFRGKEICPQLFRSLISANTYKTLFATTKADKMRRILQSLGFVQIGSNYSNEKNEVLSLFALN